jgi:hypothetical protein
VDALGIESHCVWGDIKAFKENKVVFATHSEHTPSLESELAMRDDELDETGVGLFESGSAEREEGETTNEKTNESDRENSGTDLEDGNRDNLEDRNADGKADGPEEGDSEKSKTANLLRKEHQVEEDVDELRRIQNELQVESDGGAQEWRKDPLLIGSEEVGGGGGAPAAPTTDADQKDDEKQADLADSVDPIERSADEEVDEGRRLSEQRDLAEADLELLRLGGRVGFLGAAKNSEENLAKSENSISQGENPASTTTTTTENSSSEIPPSSSKSSRSRRVAGRRASTVVAAVQPRTLCTDDDHEFSEDPHCWCGKKPLVGPAPRKVA